MAHPSPKHQHQHSSRSLGAATSTQSSPPSSPLMSHWAFRRASVDKPLAVTPTKAVSTPSLLSLPSRKGHGAPGGRELLRIEYVIEIVFPLCCIFSLAHFFPMN